MEDKFRFSPFFWWYLRRVSSELSSSYFYLWRQGLLFIYRFEDKMSTYNSFSAWLFPNFYHIFLARILGWIFIWVQPADYFFNFYFASILLSLSCQLNLDSTLNKLCKMEVPYKNSLCGKLFHNQNIYGAINPSRDFPDNKDIILLHLIPK